MAIEWIYALIGLAVGLAFGTGIGAWFGRRRLETTSVASIQKENEEFREQVTDHFVETARLINQMTDSYKAVFDHLSGGADQLVDQKTLSERLPQVTDQEVRLKRLGAKPSNAGPAVDVPGAASETGQADSDRPKTGHKAPIIRR